jgi:hypothetical protein
VQELCFGWQTVYVPFRPNEYPVNHLAKELIEAQNSSSEHHIMRNATLQYLLKFSVFSKLEIAAEKLDVESAFGKIQESTSEAITSMDTQIQELRELLSSEVMLRSGPKSSKDAVLNCPTKMISSANLIKMSWDCSVQIKFKALLFWNIVPRR